MAKMTPEERATVITEGWKAIDIAACTTDTRSSLTHVLVAGDMVWATTQRIADAIREAVAESRQMLVAQVSELLGQAHAEAEKLAESTDATDESGKLRRQYLFGKAKGIANSAGLVAEIINGRHGDDADNQDRDAKEEQAHLVLPGQEG